MATNYVLIDFENVQPNNLNVLAENNFKVVVFVGANQNKLSFQLANAMQTLGKDGRYIKLETTGKNALDFHLTYYLGELVASEPDAYFHVISRDKGFDPLVGHLKARGVHVHRESDLAEIPTLRIPKETSDDDKVKAITSNLVGRGQSRPRKVKTLSNTIKSLLAENLTDEQINLLIQELEKRKFIKITDGKVTYRSGSRTKG